MGWMILLLSGTALLTALAAVIYRDSTRFVKAEYTVRSDRLYKDCRLVLLTDLHNKSFGKDNAKLAEAVEAEAPDLIVIAGDMLTANEKKTEYDVPLALLQRLVKNCPVYYGNGNHEYRMKIYPEDYDGLYEEYREKLLSCGVCMLENERGFLPEYNLELCGLEIERRYYRRFFLRPMEDNYVEGRIGKSKADRFELLIAHNPDYFERYAEWGADLTVSGHVHGGVMRLPLLGGVISPMLRLFPRYDGGLYETDGRRMILSRGLGMHTIPLRIFNPGELVVIRLKRGNANDT